MMLISEQKQYNKLQRIVYANNNELGPHTLAALDYIVEHKHV